MLKTKTINASDLTSDCWLIQFWGLEACEDCELSGTAECGGKEIRISLIMTGEYGKITESGLPDQSE